jgi:hypothetical protein
MDTLLSPTASNNPLRKSVNSSAQLAATKEMVNFSNLPLEITKQIMSEAVSGGPLVFSTNKSRPLPKSSGSITSLLLISKRLSQEALEKMYENLHLCISGEDLDLDMGSWKNQDILAYWESKLRTIPWKSFRKIKISLIPSLYKNGTRIWNLTNLFEITQVFVPKLRLEICDEVQKGRCKVEVLCCEIDGNHISHYDNSAAVEELPLPSWTFFQLGLVLETWRWLHRKDGNPYSTFIHMPNVVLPLHATEYHPRILGSWISWLGEVWETPTSVPVNDEAVSQRDFTSEHKRKYGFVSVSGSSKDRWILVQGLQAEHSCAQNTKYKHTRDTKIENQLGPCRVKADDLLKQIRHHAVDLPAPIAQRRAKHLQLAEDLRMKAHRPGMEEITRRLEDCLEEVETLTSLCESHSPSLGSGQEAQVSIREWDEAG